MRRNPTEAETNEALALLDLGVPQEQFEARILGGVEYFVSRSDSDNSEWVNDVYRDLLGRSADPAGLAFWTAQLDAGVPRTDVATAIIHSDETINNTIRASYLRFLKRQVDPSGLASFTAEFRVGLPREQFFLRLITSTEYVNRPAG